MRDIQSSRLIDVAIKTLREEILPVITDSSARIKVDHVTRVLRAASARLATREHGLKVYVEALAGVIGVAAGEGDLETERQRLEAGLCDRMQELVSGARSGAVEELAAILSCSRDFFVSQDADVARGSAIVYRGGRIESEAASDEKPDFPPINEQTLTTYLQKVRGQPQAQVTNVKAIPGGFSKETYFFTLEDPRSGTSDDLVIRKNLSTPLLDKTVVDEFPLLKILHEQNFPVAEPLWLEEDPALFGGAFLVSRRVAGSGDVARWSANPEAVKVASLDFAARLGQLHSMDPRALGIRGAEANLSAGQAMEAEIARWFELFRRTRREAYPLQELPLLWLANNVPAELYDRPARIVHGDIGFHNLMVDESGRIAAILDWEFSILGDPVQDLCFVRQFIEPMFPWSDFLDAYVAHGGQISSGQSDFFFSLWTKARNGVASVHAQTLFDTLMPDQMRFALGGHIFGPYMFVDQCEFLVDHLTKCA